MGGISVLIMMGIFSSMLIIFLIGFIIFIVWLLLSYIFESIAIYQMSKRSGKRNYFLSFVPILKSINLSDLANKKTIGIILTIINLFKWTLFLILVIVNTNSLFNIIFTVMFILIIISIILKIYLTHQILKKVTPKASDIITVINSLTLGVISPFILFFIRNKDIK